MMPVDAPKRLICPASAARMQPLVLVRSAAQSVALHVDEVIGNQEVVVKNLGPQLSRLPGLAGITLLPSGAVAMICIVRGVPSRKVGTGSPFCKVYSQPSHS